MLVSHLSSIKTGLRRPIASMWMYRDEIHLSSCQKSGYLHQGSSVVLGTLRGFTSELDPLQGRGRIILPKEFFKALGLISFNVFISTPTQVVQH